MFGFEQREEPVRPQLDRGGRTASDLLPAELFAALESRVDDGRRWFEQREYGPAWASLGEAFALIPQPVHAWNAAGWVFAAIGECAWQLGKFTSASQVLSNALNAPGTVGNAFIHMRYGQALYEIRDPRASYELRHALAIGGSRVFSREDPIYHAFAAGMMLPEIPEQFYRDIAARLDRHAASAVPTATDDEVVVAIAECRQHAFVSAAQAGDRIYVVFGASPRPTTPGTFEIYDAAPRSALELWIDRVIHPRGRIVLCHGIVRSGTLQLGDRLRRRQPSA